MQPEWAGRPLWPFPERLHSKLGPGKDPKDQSTKLTPLNLVHPLSPTYLPRPCHFAGRANRNVNTVYSMWLSYVESDLADSPPANEYGRTPKGRPCTPFCGVFTARRGPIIWSMYPPTQDLVCVICNKGFNNERSFERHWMTCAKNQGNPDGCFIDSHPTVS